MSKGDYKAIVRHYEACFEKFGDSHAGVDWPVEEDVIKRYQVMLDVIRSRSSPISILDFGCGLSHLYEYILKMDLDFISYAGLDISAKFCKASKGKFPENKYICADVLSEKCTLEYYDYIVMNGVFTEKRELSFDEMFEYFKEVIRVVFPRARDGLAFNVMSTAVDWERDDLFHLSIDELILFLKKEISRNVVIRHDYGLYEYTVYVYREVNNG